MAIRTELTFRLPNSPGALAEVCRALGDEHVDVQALSLEASGQLRLLVDNPVHAAAILRARHHQVSERDVLVTTAPHVPGGLAAILRLVSDAAVNVEYAYAGTGEGATAATVVLATADALRGAMASGL